MLWCVFIIGLLIGVFFGMIIMALCRMSSRLDREEETRMQQEEKLG